MAGMSSAPDFHHCTKDPMKSALFPVCLLLSASLVGCCKSNEAHPEPVHEEAHQPDPEPQAAAYDPGQMAADGLPEEIPPPGSKPPSVAEWNSVQKEVRVRGSSALGCETKMMREWLRVSCRPGKRMPPSAVSTVSSGGQQAFTGMFGNTASLVVQVVQGKSYRANFRWTDPNSGNFDSQFLLVNWPSGAARPTIQFEPDDH